MTLRRVVGSAAIGLAWMIRAPLADATYPPNSGQWQSPQSPQPPPYGAPPYGYQQHGSQEYAEPPYQVASDSDDRVWGEDGYGGVGGWVLFGLRGTQLAVEGSDADATSYGLQLGAGLDGAATADLFTLRLTGWGSLGGSSESLEGTTEGLLSAGIRGSVGDHHGPYARLGYGWTAMGNDKLFFWYIELPDGQVGYQLLTEDLLVEVGARGGVMLGGGYDTGDEAERDFKTSLAWGGQALIAVTPFALSAEWLRFEARQTEPETPVDLARGRLCVGYAFAACGDVSYFRGDVSLPGGGISESSSLYIGLNLGIGIAGAVGTR